MRGNQEEAASSRRAEAIVCCCCHVDAERYDRFMRSCGLPMINGLLEVSLPILASILNYVPYIGNTAADVVRAELPIIEEDIRAAINDAQEERYEDCIEEDISGFESSFLRLDIQGGQRGVYVEGGDTEIERSVFIVQDHRREIEVIRAINGEIGFVTARAEHIVYRLINMGAYALRIVVEGPGAHLSIGQERLAARIIESGAEGAIELVRPLIAVIGYGSLYVIDGITHMMFRVQEFASESRAAMTQHTPTEDVTEVHPPITGGAVGSMPAQNNSIVYEDYELEDPPLLVDPVYHYNGGNREVSHPGEVIPTLELNSGFEFGISLV